MDYYCVRCHSQEGFRWQPDHLGEMVELCKGCGARDTKRDIGECKLSSAELVSALSVYHPPDDGPEAA